MAIYVRSGSQMCVAFLFPEIPFANSGPCGLVDGEPRSLPSPDLCLYQGER